MSTITSLLHESFLAKFDTIDVLIVHRPRMITIRLG